MWFYWDVPDLLEPVGIFHEDTTHSASGCQYSPQETLASWSFVALPSCSCSA